MRSTSRLRAPPPSSPAVTAVMRGNKARNTRPELLVRRLLTRQGFRYRLHGAALPGKPDITFPGKRCVIFVHGCYWHHHTATRCPYASMPTKNVDYWAAKFDRNRLRHQRAANRLQRDGWRVMVVWECSLLDEARLTKALIRFLH